MSAEDLFAWFGVKSAAGGFDALGFAAAEPEAAIGVEIAAVAQAMPDRARGRGSGK